MEDVVVLLLVCRVTHTDTHTHTNTDTHTKCTVHLFEHTADNVTQALSPVVLKVACSFRYGGEVVSVSA